ncbi:hypothetical protein PoB_004264300 [Plakobranchus ocellatus]|uniref:Uncharacterized protein n=1 Tax=Plakobranchus ocellatus TaxID=259542 RepID=A0AAV4BBF4_9GAST|nr:hypothetical protein PoB_004264300 [Plakobranchus ocellatus]
MGFVETPQTRHTPPKTPPVFPLGRISRPPEPLLSEILDPALREGLGDTVASESALRSAGTLLSRVRAPPPTPWPDGNPESLRSPCCGLAIRKNQTGRSGYSLFALAADHLVICTVTWSSSAVCFPQNRCCDLTVTVFTTLRS